MFFDARETFQRNVSRGDKNGKPFVEENSTIVLCSDGGVVRTMKSMHLPFSCKSQIGIVDFRRKEKRTKSVNLNGQIRRQTHDRQTEVSRVKIHASKRTGLLVESWRINRPVVAAFSARSVVQSHATRSVQQERKTYGRSWEVKLVV